jgi:hypothetical protein
MNSNGRANTTVATQAAQPFTTALGGDFDGDGVSDIALLGPNQGGAVGIALSPPVSGFGTFAWVSNTVGLATFIQDANLANVYATSVNHGGAWISNPASITFPIKINYQPATAPVPAGYIVDGGDVFGARGNGYSYGWSVSQVSTARDRGVSADQRLDTLNQFHASAKWEVSVPNGSYKVFVSIGDPSYASTYTINVEGVNYWNAAALAKNAFANMTKTVTVTDGKITIDQGAAAELATRINYVEISL